MLDLKSESVSNEFNRCLKQNFSQKDIKDLPWPEDTSEIHFMSDSCSLSEEKLQFEVDPEKRGTEHPQVVVKVFSLRWMFSGKEKFIDVAEMMAKRSNSFYSSQFVTSLLAVFWKRDQRRIIFIMFIPYLFYTALTIYSMYFTLRSDINKDDDQTYN